MSVKRSLIVLTVNICFALAILVGGANKSFAVIYNLNGSDLQGADGVIIGNMAYSVQFIDGTCANLFNGCDQLSDLDFPSVQSATAAAQALLDQVFVNGPFGSFDSQPSLTRGCELPSECNLLIPYELSPGFANGAAAVNGSGITSNDRVVSDFGGVISINNDTINSVPAPWAIFTQTGTVPLPQSAILYISCISVTAFAWYAKGVRSKKEV